MAQPVLRPAAEEPLAIETAATAGDPVADYVAMWLALDLFHERGRLTEEGWTFLTEHLQRPLELRLLERTPVTLDGAMRALTLAAHLMEHLDHGGSEGQRAWYRRLRSHLVTSARDSLERRLQGEAPARPEHQR